jgi:uroporphyrinogen decarboxylase
MISKRQRIEAIAAGRPADRPALSFWTHFPGTDLDPAAIARTTVEFAKEFDLDLVKSMPNGFFPVEDWGAKVDYGEVSKGGVAKIVHSPIVRPDDWQRVCRLDVTANAWGRELDHLARLTSALGPGWPVLATVFSPVTIAKKLAGNLFFEHQYAHPQLIRDALAEIAATMADFARRAIDMGCVGVFVAVQDATPEVSEAVYRDIGEPFDRAVLAGAARGWFNTVHMHGDAILFDLLAAYPVQCLNWHIGETPPSLADYRRAGGRKAILGGLRRMAITSGDLAALRQDIAAVRSADGGRGVVFGPACVIRHPVDRNVLKIVADEIRSGGVL